MVVLIIFPVILQTDINVIMLSVGGQNKTKWHKKAKIGVNIPRAGVTSVPIYS